jgi:3-oxosteroid 1-dehydrogenase
LPHMVMVNAAGKRFANEAKPYNELGRDIFEEADQPIYIVFDDSYRNKYSIVGMLPGITPATYIDNGFVKRAETIEALSEQTGIDQAGLAATILRFNEMANAGRDEDFHKGESAFDLYAGYASHQPNPCLGPIATAPFYAIRVFPGDLGSKGGLLINEHAQVQRPDGSIIEGLYAVGNSSASVMGNFYPGAGGTIGPAMTFGYIAALSAAARE